MAGSSLLALLDDIASILDDVAVMSKGQVVYSGKPDELRANDAIKSSYLGI